MLSADEQVHRASAVELRAAPVDRTEDAKQKEFNSSRISEGTPLEDTYNNIKGLLKHSLGFKSAARYAQHTCFDYTALRDTSYFTSTICNILFCPGPQALCICYML